MSRVPILATKRVDPLNLFYVLATISRHQGIVVPEIADDLKISESTVRRIMRVAKVEYGVKLKFSRSPGGQEWSVVDWGVFNASRVLQTVRPATSHSHQRMS